MSEVSPLPVDQSGIAAVEYGLIAALVAVVIIGAVTTLWTNLSNKFNFIASQLTDHHLPGL